MSYVAQVPLQRYPVYGYPVRISPYRYYLKYATAAGKFNRDQTAPGCSPPVFSLLIFLTILVCVVGGLCIYFGINLAQQSSSGGSSLSLKRTANEPVFPNNGRFNGQSAQASQNLQLASKKRLSGTVWPTRYRLRITVNLPSENTKLDNDTLFTFSGEVTILINCSMVTNEVELNFRDLSIDEKNISFTELDQAENSIFPIPLAPNGFHADNLTEKITIKLSTELFPGRRYSVTLRFVGVLIPDSFEPKGLFRQSYKDNGETRWLAATQFEADDARSALPCFDEPHLKAVFDVTLVHPVETTALSNMPEKSSNELGDGWKETTFLSSPIMSSYLLAMSVSTFAATTSSASGGSTLIRTWAPSSMINLTNYANDVCQRVLLFFENYYNIPFPLDKLDQFALPIFNGGMENWGLITYGQPYLLYNLSEHTAIEQNEINKLIAHEVAHQWFGNLVTMRWWNDLWLNEGVTMYMERIGAEDATNGRLSYFDQGIEDMQVALMADQSSLSRPVKQSEANTVVSIQLFDSITYGKGAAVLQMLNFTIGETLFRKAINYYLQRFAYQNAESDDLWASFSWALGGETHPVTDWNNQPLNVKYFMDPWILQAGFPVLFVERMYPESGDIQFRVNQTRFRVTVSSQNQTAKNNTSFENVSWYVPVWFCTKSNPSSRMEWLRPFEQRNISEAAPTEPVFGNWLLVNPNAQGFYRVNYDLTNWELIQKQLLQNPEVFTVRTRTQLLDDAFELANAQQLSYSVALGLTLYLSTERNYIPWHTAVKHLSLIKRNMRDAPEYGYFEKYLQRLITPAYETLAWGEPKGEQRGNFYALMLRKYLLPFACEVDVPGCANTARSLFLTYKTACAANATSCSINIPYELRLTTLCTAVRKGTSEDWEYVWQRFQTEEDRGQKAILVLSLGCSREPWLITRLLNEIFNGSKLSMSDTLGIVGSVLASESIAAQMLWNYLQQNMAVVQEMLQSSEKNDLATALLQATASTFRSTFQADQLTDMLKKVGQNMSSGALAYLNQTIADVRTNVQWLKLHGEEILQWTKLGL